MNTLPVYDGTQTCLTATPAQVAAFTGDPLGDSRGAQTLCDTCRFQSACRSYALSHDVRGIWGGTNDHERNHQRRMERLPTPRSVSDDLDDLIHHWRSAS